MGWSGRALAPPASEAGKGRQRQGARHVSDTQYRDRRDRHRYRQELVPRRGPRCARRHRAAAKVVAAPWWPRSALETYSPKAATSAPGSDWCPSRSRRETARSSAKSRGAATATCAFCSCRRHGLCWSGSRTGNVTGLKSWIEAAKRRLHHNVLAIALANKLARIAWAVLNKGRAFECVKTNEMASRPA